MFSGLQHCRRDFLRLAGTGLAVSAGYTGQSALAAERRAVPAFDPFFEEFRTAVLAKQREVVAGMVAFPFIDFREGRYCEAGSTGCQVQPDSLTSRHRLEFLAKYDGILSSPVVEAIRDRRLRHFRGRRDADAAGPIQPGEVLLDLEDVELQRVFGVRDGAYKLLRVPFYS